MALICQISHQAFAKILAASFHDSHTEVHQPSSISKFRTSHHTSSGHLLYEGDLVSKTSNLNDSSLGGGGEKKLLVGLGNKFFLFGHSPPAGRSPGPGPVAGD